jgi:hypothetical protein
VVATERNTFPGYFTIVSGLIKEMGAVAAAEMANVQAEPVIHTNNNKTSVLGS